MNGKLKILKIVFIVLVFVSTISSLSAANYGSGDYGSGSYGESAVCGNDICESGESCGSCSNDCGGCPTTTGGATGSGDASKVYFKGTYKITSEEFRLGYTQKLEVRERIRFTLNNEVHFIKVLSLTPVSATISISSEAQKATLYLFQTKRFDVDNDSIDDIEIKLNSIDLDKANITIKATKIEEPSVEEEITEELTKEKIEEEIIRGLREITGGLIKEDIEEDVRIIWPWIFITIMIIIIAIIFGYYEKRLKKK